MHATPLNPADMFARILQSVADNGLEAERTFQLESMFAAGHSPRLREMNNTERDRYAKTYESVTGVPDAWEHPEIWPFIVANRAIMRGQMLMLAYGFMDALDPCIPMLARRLAATLREAHHAKFGTREPLATWLAEHETESLHGTNIPTVGFSLGGFDEHVGAREP